MVCSNCSKYEEQSDASRIFSHAVLRASFVYEIGISDRTEATQICGCFESWLFFTIRLISKSQKRITRMRDLQFVEAEIH